MNRRTAFLAVAIGAMSGALMAQQATSAQSTTTTTTTTVTGSVVQYSPGQSIVVQGADGKTTTYTIGSSVQVPADVQIGRSVTLSTQPGKNGAQATVTSIEVKTVNPADSPLPPGRAEKASNQYSGSSGQSSEVPPTSGLASGTSASQMSQSETTQTTTTYSGKVTAYSPKQSITIEEPGNKTVTYVIDAQSELPQDVAVGKTVTITTRTVEGKPVIRTVKTTTTTTKSTETHPQ